MSDVHVVIRSAESELRTPRRLAAEMLRDLRASPPLAWRLLVRDIKAQYRQSYFGILWALVPPVAMAAGFTLARNANVVNVGETVIPYPAYVMLSMTLWQTFVAAVHGPVDAVTRTKTMIARIVFPREAIVIAKVGEVAFDFAIKLVLIAAVFWLYQVPVGAGLLLAPFAVCALVLLGILVGVLLAPLGVLYHDVPRGLTVATSTWLFLTPIVYPVPAEGWFGTIVRLNPVTPLLVTTRELAISAPLSDPGGFAIVGGATLVLLIGTWVSFRLAMPYAIERVTA